MALLVFVLWNLFMETCFCSFLIKRTCIVLIFVMRYCPHNCGWCVIRTRVHALTNGIQQPVCSAPSVFPAKNYRSEVAVMLKTKLKRHILRGFPGYWWLFWTQHLSHYSSRLFEERRWTILTFDRFQLCHFKIVTTRCYYYCRLGQAL